MRTIVYEWCFHSETLSQKFQRTFNKDSLHFIGNSGLNGPNNKKRETGAPEVALGGVKCFFSASWTDAFTPSAAQIFMNCCVFQHSFLSLCLSGAALCPSLWLLLFLTPLSCLTTVPTGTCTIKNSSLLQQPSEVHHLEQSSSPLALAAELPGSWKGEGRRRSPPPTRQRLERPLESVVVSWGLELDFK